MLGPGAEATVGASHGVSWNNLHWDHHGRLPRNCSWSRLQWCPGVNHAGAWSCSWSGDGLCGFAGTSYRASVGLGLGAHSDSLSSWLECLSHAPAHVINKEGEGHKWHYPVSPTIKRFPTISILFRSCSSVSKYFLPVQVPFNPLCVIYCAQLDALKVKFSCYHVSISPPCFSYLLCRSCSISPHFFSGEFLSL